MSASSEELQSALQKTFGFSSFRPGQKEAILALLEKGRLLCIQPTGHGKSLLYQLPSCLLEGITLVISPLLALMRDQIDQLHKRFKIPAASLNSDQTEEENLFARQMAEEKRVKVLFVSPEQLDHTCRFQFLLNLPLSLLVIDEAHCISTWGHDFRPSYRQILRFVEECDKKKSDMRILALTATADERTEKDIKKQLSYSQEEIEVMRESMDRPNISLSVIEARGTSHKLHLLETLLTRLEGCGLIYCATRENTEMVAHYLEGKKISAAAYHAGLEPEEKRSLQEAFAKDSYKVIAATNALGMGIDKNNLRFILHFDIPGSITAYYQEVGRAGRDGKAAQGILLYDPQDRKIQEHFIESSMPSLEDFQKVLRAVETSTEPCNLTAIKRLTGLHPTRVTIVAAELIEQEALVKESVKNVQIYRVINAHPSLDLSRYTTQHLVKTKELDRMIRYAEEKKECRMALLRNALGDQSPSSCKQCDACKNTFFSMDFSKEAFDAISRWLEERPVSIPPAKSVRMSAGFSLFDGKLRLPFFIRFMKERALLDTVDGELLALLKKEVDRLLKGSSIGAVIPLPSRTWKSREFVANALANHLQAKNVSLLRWKTLPGHRQGELLNNDQRHYNVHEKMEIDPEVDIPSGNLLLLDDYMGSGSTLKEAARTLRKATKGEVIPVTIAAVKWHLGKPGFI